MALGIIISRDCNYSGKNLEDILLICICGKLTLFHVKDSSPHTKRELSGCVTMEHCKRCMRGAGLQCSSSIAAREPSIPSDGMG